VQPKNHHADNLRQLREQQEANRRAREEASRPPPPLFKLPEFDAVEAKILKDEKDASDAPRHEFLRRSDKVCGRPLSCPCHPIAASRSLADGAEPAAGARALDSPPTHACAAAGAAPR
jgi:hypothetical protein